MKMDSSFISGDNVFTKQKIQYWLGATEEIDWYAFIWYISQFISIIDFTDNDIMVEFHSIGEYDFFVETAKDYKDIINRHSFELAKNNHFWWLFHKNPDLNRKIVERLMKINN